VSQRLTDGKVPELKVFESNGLGRNQVAPIGGPGLEWDDNGNLTRKGDFHYKWDFRNRLVRVTRDGVGEIARYEYDAFDRRVVRTVESVEHQTSWAGWQALETRKAGALVDRRVYGVGLDEVVAIGLDVTGDGAIDGAYVPLYDSSGNVAVLTGSDGRVVERYDYRAFGPRETRVDSVRPQLTSERIASSSFVVSWDEEISGEVLSERIGAEEIEITLDDAPLVIEWSDPEGVPTADGGLAETKSAAKSTADVVVSLPVEAGRRTLRFAFTTPPAPGAEIVVTLPVGAIEDYYNNATTEPATWSAATIDQGAVDWASCENGFGLCQQTCLAAGGSHTLELGATLADLAGNALDGGAVGHGFDLSTTDTLHIWRRPDPRLLTSATGSVVDKSVSSAVRQALGFHGLPIDPETGLVYVRHRYYDPEMGRFLSQDPLGYVDGGNLYQYGLNNPADLSDPLGLWTNCQPGAAPSPATCTPEWVAVEGRALPGLLWSLPRDWVPLLGQLAFDESGYFGTPLNRPSQVTADLAAFDRSWLGRGTRAGVAAWALLRDPSKLVKGASAVGLGLEGMDVVREEVRQKAKASASPSAASVLYNADRLDAEGSHVVAELNRLSREADALVEAGTGSTPEFMLYAKHRGKWFDFFFHGRAIQAETERLIRSGLADDPLLARVQVRSTWHGLKPDFVFRQQGGQAVIIDLTAPNSTLTGKIVKYLISGEEILVELYHKGFKRKGGR
jgi:RHS repeat-associated protein